MLLGISREERVLQHRSNLHLTPAFVACSFSPLLRDPTVPCTEIVYRISGQ